MLIDYLQLFITSAVDKTRNMEHPGTFRNIPEHPGTSNNYDNYEKKCMKLNFGLADVTIWSVQMRTEELFTVGNQLQSM